MADKDNGDVNGHAEDGLAGGISNLEGFISAQMQQQEKTSKESDNLDTGKRDSFIARAMAESRRMNKEIQKSKEKRERLYEELGESRMTEWRNEHSAEVLTQHQANLVNQTFDQVQQ